MEIPFFSIIVPVYNVAPYLEKCVASILEQSYSYFEVILVDDGSIDGSATICDSLSFRSSKVRVFHKPNGGSSSARNLGIEAAKGMFLLFMDGDDFWCSNALLSELNARIVLYQEDVVLYRCQKLLADGCFVVPRGEYDLVLIGTHDKAITLKHLNDTNNIPGAAWIMCARRDLIHQNNLRFKEGITAEDYDWCLKLLYYANSIGAINSIDYVYVSRSNSVTTSAKPSGVLGISYAIQEWLTLDNRPEVIDNYLGKVFLLSLMSFCQLDKSVRKDLMPFVKKDSVVLKKGGLNSMYLLFNAIGPVRMGRFISLMYSIRTKILNARHA